ncbi:AraC-like DNA-binding protein [Amycolatopsis endophytica]|uniref:AraC-like DNA-binding protein n=1 Tax=Amycolatopsis endophytica TaxID=860233 RepID=A0A853B3X5_9PSEU|nr:AraC family transcriptional regulator [Amycolatopsis endophytica]NYI89336.1 AraC-like DNA-binding protein [Amycolatopsis endophytica]
MDLLSAVIRTVRVGSASGRVIKQPMSSGIKLPAFKGTGFHIILHGDCWLITENEEPVALKPGDVVLTSSGGEHSLSPFPCALDALPALVPGTDSPPGPYAFEFVCGAYRLEHGQSSPYLRALADLIVVSPDYDRHPEMRALVDLLGADLSGARTGTGATLPALLDLILVHVLREWSEQNDMGEWPRTDDPRIDAALQAIHDNPQRPWTVQRLSETAGLSRTAFSRRFAAAVGQPPMSYLISWRLSRGAQLLRDTDAPLASIARRVGYATEFAFAGAFRREYGVSPGRFRLQPATSCLADGVSAESADAR